MKAIIVHSTSKLERSLKIAQTIEGDLFRIEHVKPVYKSKFAQMFFYGYLTVANKKVQIKPMSIDFGLYDEIYLVSPVWAGRVNAFMRQFLKEYPLINKKIHVIATCEGGYKNYFKTVETLLDQSNEIIEKTVYVNGELIK